MESHQKVQNPSRAGGPAPWWWPWLQALLTVALAGLLFGAAGGWALRHHWFSGLDRWQFVPSASGPLTQFFLFVTWFGTVPGVASTSAVMLLLLLWQRWFRQAAAFTLAVLTAALANDWLKDWVGRERPSTTGWLAEAGGFAFPSGHAFVCLAVYGLFGWFVVQRAASSWVRWVVGGALALFIGLLGFSRLYLGVHYPSDVLAGWLLGLVWAAAFARAAGVRRPWERPASVHLP